jgi:hypothetical protein
MLSRLKYVDLMKLVDLETDATAGSWLFTKGVFSSSDKPVGTLGFPVDVTGDYGLSLTIAKTKDAGDIRFTFPVAGKMVGLGIRESTEQRGKGFWPGPGGGGGGGGGKKRPAPGPGPGSGLPMTQIMINMRLEDVEDQPGSSATNPMNPDYAAHPWVPYVMEVGVRTTGDNVEIAVTLNQAKWVSWKGTKNNLTGPAVSPGRGFTLRYGSPGLALSAAKLRPTSGEVSLAGGKVGDPPRSPPAGDSGRPRPGDKRRPPGPPDGGPGPGDAPPPAPKDVRGK